MTLARVSKAIAGAIVGAIAPHIGLAVDGEIAMNATALLASLIGAALGYALVWIAPKNAEPSQPAAKD